MLFDPAEYTLRLSCNKCSTVYWKKDTESVYGAFYFIIKVYKFIQRMHFSSYNELQAIGDTGNAI